MGENNLADGSAFGVGGGVGRPFKTTCWGCLIFRRIDFELEESSVAVEAEAEAEEEDGDPSRIGAGAIGNA